MRSLHCIKVQMLLLFHVLHSALFAPSCAFSKYDLLRTAFLLQIVTVDEVYKNSKVHV